MIFLRKSIALTLKIFLLVCLVLLACYHLLLIDIPDVKLLKTFNPSRSNYMNTDAGSLSLTRPSVENFITYNNIPQSVVRAVLVAEDDTFFFHHGFNWKAIKKSFQLNLKRKKFARGGSTISQQLARNLFLTRSKTILRKIREVLLTYQMERNLNKERILELYLNTAEFGPSTYGLSAAADYHFHQKPSHLTNDQAALLAAVLPNPKLYGHKPYPKITTKRQGKILARMARYDPLQPPKEKKKKDDKKVTQKQKTTTSAEQKMPATIVLEQKTPQPEPLTDDVLDQTEDLMDDEEESQFLDE